jgi:ribonuclease P protein component
LKIAFTVGLKIDKRAVVRNRLKRQIREVVRLLIKDKKIKTGYYALFVARVGIKEKEYSDMQKEILELLHRAKVML